MLVLGHDAVKRKKGFKGLVSEDPQKPARGESRILEAEWPWTSASVHQSMCDGYLGKYFLGGPFVRREQFKWPVICSEIPFDFSMNV